MQISEEAVEAATAVFPWQAADYLDNETVRAALEAAAPHILADHLLTLAKDARARGDIGKDGGVEAWDYLAFHAEKARANPYRSQA